MTIEAITSANMQNRAVGSPNGGYRLAPITKDMLNLFDEETRNMLINKKASVEKEVRLSKLKALGYFTLGLGIDAIDPIFMGGAYDMFLQHKFKKIR